MPKVNIIYLSKEMKSMEIKEKLLKRIKILNE